MKKWLLASVKGVGLLAARTSALAETRTVVLLQSLAGRAAFSGAPVGNGLFVPASTPNAHHGAFVPARR